MRFRLLLGRLILPLAILLLYFLVPIADNAPVGEAVGFSVAALSIIAVAWVVMNEFKRAVKRLRPAHLLLAYELVLVGFSFGYYLLATARPGEFDGIATRLDALYFSLTAMSTVGFGDVNAVGQLARGIVTAQLAFNLVFVAGLVSLLQDQVRSAMANRRHAGQAESEVPAATDPAPEVPA